MNKRFASVMTFANCGGDSIVTMAEDIARHKVNEMTNSKKYSVVEMSESGVPMDLHSKYKQLDEKFVAELSARTGVTMDSVFNDVVSFANHPSVASMSTTVQKVMVDTMLPIFINATGLSMLADMHYVEYGQPLEFTLKDDQLYSVSEMSRRQRAGKRQEKKTTKVTITPKMYGLTTFTTLPQVIQGIDSVAEDSAKMAMSIAKKIYTLVLKEFKTKTEAFTDANWVVTNYAEKTFLSKVLNLDAYNGDKSVIVGDMVALKSIIPASTAIRILIADEFNTTLGYMAMWNGHQVIAFDRVSDSDETTGFLGLDENRVYAMSMGSKLVQVGIGYTYAVTDDIRANNDLSADVVLAKEIGVKLVTKKKIVKCTLT